MIFIVSALNFYIVIYLIKKNWLSIFLYNYIYEITFVVLVALFSNTY